MKYNKGFLVNLLPFTIVIILLTGFRGIHQAYAEEPENSQGDSKENQAYKIEKPGTITFTVGVKIKGKVEKPQVMIFLPKEKPVYKEHTLDRSFSEELAEPLDLAPVID